MILAVLVVHDNLIEKFELLTFREPHHLETSNKSMYMVCEYNFIIRPQGLHELQFCRYCSCHVIERYLVLFYPYRHLWGTQMLFNLYV